MNTIPQLIPVESEISETPEISLDAIQVGNILVGDMTLAGKAPTIGSNHTIRITGLGDNDSFVGEYGDHTFEIGRVWKSDKVLLHSYDDNTGVEQYYGFLTVKSIQEGIPTVRYNGDDLEYTDIPIDGGGYSNDIGNIPGSHTAIDTTKNAVSSFVGFDVHHPSKKIQNLSYLGNLFPGKIMTGHLERPDKKIEEISYRIGRVSGSSITLMRKVYNPRTKEIKMKEYLLSNIAVFTDQNAIGTISSIRGGVRIEKGDFIFPIAPSQSKIAGAIQRIIGV